MKTAETACGGNPWAATYLDCFRYLEQLGRLAKKNVQVVMHNTLARSEYALLDHDTHNPRPNYWVALLWNKLMGMQVYNSVNLINGVDIFVHNLKGKHKGRAVLILNTTDKISSIQIPSNGKFYLFTADELSTKTVILNGKELKLTDKNELPTIRGEKISSGLFQIPSKSILFLEYKKV